MVGVRERGRGKRTPRPDRLTAHLVSPCGSRAKRTPTKNRPTRFSHGWGGLLCGAVGCAPGSGASAAIASAGADNEAVGERGGDGVVDRYCRGPLLDTRNARRRGHLVAWRGSDRPGLIGPRPMNTPARFLSASECRRFWPIGLSRRTIRNIARPDDTTESA